MLIKIKNKEYIGQCNALSYIFYNSLFGKNIIHEIVKLRECFENLEKNILTEESIQDIYDILTRVIYTLIYTHDTSIDSYGNFLKEIQKQTISNETMNQVIEILLKNFTDEQVAQELDKIGGKSKEKSIFPEHEFLNTCLGLNLSIEDLKILRYIDVIKMLILMNKTIKENAPKDYREATQADIDKLLM